MIDNAYDDMPTFEPIKRRKPLKGSNGGDLPGVSDYVSPDPGYFVGEERYAEGELAQVGELFELWDLSSSLPGPVTIIRAIDAEDAKQEGWMLWGIPQGECMVVPHFPEVDAVEVG